MNTPKSTKEHRVSQRINAAMEVVASSGMYFSPAAALPPKISQLIISGYGMFKGQAKRHERIIDGVQSVCAAIHTIALAGLCVNQDNCEDTKSTYCQIALIAQLSYEGLLLASWALSEKEKEGLHQDVHQRP